MAERAFYDLPAPAKINAFLHVTGRRADGYHLLQSPFVLIDWCDLLHVERRDDGRIARHDLGAALPADDLCLRAARALQQASGTTLGADVSIDKRVPWGAGLGGGSSDAATVLLALNRLWRLDWPRERLAALALTLGADVPFFIGGTHAFVEGIGERLTPIAWPHTWYAVLKPAAALPTAQIFSSPLLRRDTEAVIVPGSLASAGQGVLGANGWSEGFGRNDLQPAAEHVCGDVAQAAALLHRSFGNSRMTGSGSAVFARAGTGEAPLATLPESSLQGLPEGWVFRMCRSLDRHPLGRWAS